MVEYIKWFVDFVLHMDARLADVVTQYGVWVYGILFAVIFAETGFVVTPFLPGDSLLFATGAIAANSKIAATGHLNPFFMTILLTVAAILGDTVNYWIGKKVGPKVFSRPKSFFFNTDHLTSTHKFYDRHGGKTIIIARFLPIIRTFAPFVAGIGSMSYRRFIFFNVIGAVLWVPAFIYAGYFFGNMPFVKKNFTLVVFGIILVSVLPAVYHVLQSKFGKHPPEPGAGGC